MPRAGQNCANSFMCKILFWRWHRGPGRNRSGITGGESDFSSQNENHQKKINPEPVAYFLHPKKRPSEHHIEPAFHHKITIKKPRSAARFRQKPLQKYPNLSDKKNTKIRNQLGGN